MFSVLGAHLARGAVPVVTGFIGRGEEGATVTLGRGGSDLTASLVAAALNADSVTLWKEVEGVFSADPRDVADARVVEHLNYAEAAELSHCGAKVIHPRSMVPVARKRIPIRVRSFAQKESPGTSIDGGRREGSHPVKSVSAVTGQALLSIEGKGMTGVPGVLSRILSAIAHAGISVTMVSQSSSEATICLALSQAEAGAARVILKKALRFELERGAVDALKVRGEVALISIVGIGMAQKPGVAGTAASSLGAAGVNILAIAQGSSELAITFAVDAGERALAVRTLHRAFGLHRIDVGVEGADGLEIAIVGAGRVGRAFARLLEQRRAVIEERFHLRPRVVAVADSTGFVLEPGGLTRERLDRLLEDKGEGLCLAERPSGRRGTVEQALREAALYRFSRPVLVDATDSERADALFVQALESGFDVVSANKKPLAGAWERYAFLQETLVRCDGRLRAEATVGAGLPVMETLDMLVGAGDAPFLVEGCFSGTLGVVSCALTKGERLSRAVRSAHELGFTEPDPAVDLTGEDVARKAIILGRMSGLLGREIEMCVDPIVPGGLEGLGAQELFARLETYDEPLARRAAQAARRGEVLRYLARIEPGRISVGLSAVSAGSPAGRLAGSENLVSFHTERYREIPLSITGPGAGPEVTAMGVLSDVLKIAAERRTPRGVSAG